MSLNAPKLQKWTKFIKKWMLFVFHSINSLNEGKMQLISERNILIGPSPAEQLAQTFAQLLLGHPVYNGKTAKFEIPALYWS